MIKPTPLNQMSPRVPIEDIRKLADSGTPFFGKGNNRIRLTLSSFHTKCIFNGACAGCGLVIVYGQAFQPQNNSRTRMYYFGIRNGKSVCFTKDHILPKSHGGGDDADNIQLMCSDCNNLKSDSTSDNPEMWLLRRKIMVEYSVEKYQDAFVSGDLNEEAFGVRINRCKHSKRILRKTAREVFNIAI